MAEHRHTCMHEGTMQRNIDSIPESAPHLLICLEVCHPHGPVPGALLAYDTGQARNVRGGAHPALLGHKDLCITGHIAQHGLIAAQQLAHLEQRQHGAGVNARLQSHS